MYLRLLFALTLTCSCFAQSNRNIGMHGGPVFGRFMNFSKEEDYQTNYPIKSGGMLSLFYEIEEDSVVSFRLSAQYLNQQGYLEIDKSAGHDSFYDQINFSSRQFRFMIDYDFLITPNRKFDLRLITGLGASYTFNTFVDGNGWRYISQTQTDSSGNQVSFQTTEPWELHERRQDLLNPIGVVVHLGCSLALPLTSRSSIFFQNDYFLNTNNVIKMKDYRYTVFLSGAISVGLRYWLK